MKQQRLLDPQTEPAGGFRYPDPNTGFVVKARNLRHLFESAEGHRTANGLAIPDGFRAEIESWLCRQLPPGQCVYLDGSGLGGSLCVHRGGEVRQIICSSCGGGVRARVFACAVHGECTLFSQDVGVKQCGTCQDRKEPE